MNLDSDLKPHIWFTLYNLLKQGAGTTSIRLSTSELAEVLRCSQQSASRHLQVLDELGLIERGLDPRGSLIKITPLGCKKLMVVLDDLKYFLEGEPSEPLVFEGEVVSGLFQGAYYISKDGYREQIKNKLGFDPFPGTLNIRIDDKDISKRNRLVNRSCVILEGFKDKDRAFGSCRCYPLMMNNKMEGALIIADRTIHDDNVMEIISPYYLRKELDLLDGNRVRVVFSSPPRCVS
jgi:riboflavin kinase